MLILLININIFFSIAKSFKDLFYGFVGFGKVWQNGKMGLIVGPKISYGI
jgi:hypothetical protein